MTALPPDFQRLGHGHHRLACPECAKATQRCKDTALSIDVMHEGGAWLCHRCGWRGRWDTARNYARLVAPARSATPAKQAHLSLAANWRSLWSSLQPITPGTTAHAYLTARCCLPPPRDGDLRCTESLRHPSGYVGPALVALVTDALTGEPMTLHRTWIKADGTKADVDPPRLLLGKHRKAGGVVRLFPDDAVTTGLSVAEGIETALAVATVYQPVWSAIDAGNLAAFPVLEGIQSILIAADNDPAGLRAAEQCAECWYRAGRRVRIAKSPIPGEDLNDCARIAA